MVVVQQLRQGVIGHLQGLVLFRFKPLSQDHRQIETHKCCPFTADGRQTMDWQAKGQITPTCVGTTRRACLTTLQTPVHPHLRGDNMPQRSAVSGLGDFGFTPTCVGTTLKDCVSEILTAAMGSPPPAWGQQVSQKSMTAPFRGVHPHLRGDNFIGTRSLSSASSNGSPPPAWGQRHAPLPASNCSLTGSPPPAWGQRAPTATNQGLQFGGSPPPAWGQPAARSSRMCSYVLSRFTPTCVGTTGLLSFVMLQTVDSVHPHLRGDNVSPSTSCTVS